MAFRRPTRRSFALVVSTICALVALFALAGNAGAATRTGGTGTDPWIASELPDYAPGSTVNLLGGSWQPGEAVHINVNDNDGQTWARDVDVTADPSGDISDSFALPNWFVAQYTVTATGASGTATTTFTDGNLTIHLATADQASPAPSAISFSYTTFNQDTSCSTSGSTQTAGPSAAPFNVGIGGSNNSARAVSAAASGYTFAYFSNSATSATPLTGSQLCFSNSGDVYAHFTLATRSTITSLTSNNNPSTFGQSVTFTATVTASAGNPGANGSVTFKDGASTITGCSSVALNASSQATCTTSALDAAASPHSVTAVYSGATSGGTTWNGSTSSALSQTVNKAASTTTVTCTAGPFVYNGSAKTPCSATVTGDGGLNQAATVSYSNNVNAGTATASASYAGDTNHNSSSDSKNFTIGQAGSTTTVTCDAGPFVYNGSAQSPCSAVVAGAGGLSQSLSVDYSNNTHAGTASASAAYAGDANHTGSNDAQSFTIAKRDVTASISAAGKTYDGSDSADITGCSLESATGDHGVISGDTVGCAASNGHFADANAGSGKTVSADVALNGTAKDDYHLTGGTASTTANIDKADSTTTVTCGAGPFVYDGTAHTPCSAHVTGAGGLDEALSVDYAGNLHAGTATASATFAGDGNHKGSDDSKGFTIAERDVTASITAASKTYDGSDSATIDSCSLESASGNHGVVSGDAVGCAASNGHFEDADAGSGKDVSADVELSGADKADYHLTSATASTTADIDKAGSTTTVTCPAGPYVYNGSAQSPCSAVVAGAGGLNQSLSVDYSNNTHAGTASASAAYAGDANHTGSNDSQTFTIAKRDVTAAISAAGKTYDGSDDAEITGCSLESASGDHGVVSGDAVGCTGSNGHFEDANAGSGKGVSADVELSGADKADYHLTSGTASTTADIDKADSTTTVTCDAGPFVYDGSAQTPCSAHVSGAGGLNQSLSVDYSNNTHAGTASASAAYAGDANHTGSNDSQTFTIAKRDVTASITAAGKTYDGGDTAEITGCSLEAQSGNHGVVSPDAVGCTGTNGHFADKHAGADKSVAADVTLTGDDKADYRLTSGSATTTATIQQRQVTASITAAGKTYDGSHSAAITGCSLESSSANHGVISGDAVGCAASNGHFADKHAGADKSVSADVALTGDDKADYQLGSGSATTTATIDRRDVTASITAAGKTYDGDDSATIDSCSLEAQAGNHGVVSPDAVGCAGSNGHFANKHVGAGKSVSADVALTGDDKADYRPTSGSAATTADIDAADLDIAAVADSKVYDGTTSSTGIPTVSGLQGTDTVTGKTQAFASKNVLGANGSTLDVTGYTVNDGNSGGDYDVHAHAATGTISAAGLHISAVIDSKMYDGNADSTGTPTVAGLQTGDTVTGKTQAFQSKDVLGPNGSTLVVTGYTVNDGNSGGNYAVTTHTAAGTITKKGLTVSGITASDKVFDGNSTASLNLGGAALVGVISPDAVALNTGAAAGTFANPGVGTWTVTVSGLTLSGGASGNYSLAQPTTTASILPWNAAGRGFYAPVGADAAHSLFTAAPGITPTVKPSTMDWNSAKGGSTVPLKFNVFAGTVERTTADAFPGANLATAFGAAKLNVCTDTTSEDPVDFTTTGSTSLRYDGTAGQWIQNWKTPNVTGDSCYRAWVTLADGSTLEAFFKLKK
jgi:YDG domain-containing protein/Big-like domain-containing protein